MNEHYSPSMWRELPPTNPEARKFWDLGAMDLTEAEKYRRTDWEKLSRLIERGIALQSAATRLDRALSLRVDR